MWATWQHWPEWIDPIALSLGPLILSWYAVFYVSGLSISLFLFWKILRRQGLIFSTDDFLEGATYLVCGVLIGARLGYVLFYYPSFYWEHPTAILWPWDAATGAWIGIAGMSYYGGLLGAIVGLYFFARQQKKNFWSMADALALAVPVGYFFGRIGNFVNGELYGRVMERTWGMFFPLSPDGGTLLRHPTQLYEAFLEGWFLFGALLFLRRFVHFPGGLAVFYLIGYALIRFWIEFFRNPDPQLGLFFGIFSLSQLFSLGVLFSGWILLWWLKRRNDGILNPFPH